MKQGAVTDIVTDNPGVDSGLVGCPTPTQVITTDCSMMDKDLKGGAELFYIVNVESWQDCGNSTIALLIFIILSFEYNDSYVKV